MSVLVVGSFIADLVARCERAPQAGETVAGISFNCYLGGKGANQAIAAKRMGAEVTMAGCVGDDIYGKEFFSLFDCEGMSTQYIKVSDASKTGCSLVTVESSGQNRICMVAGSNLDYTATDVARLDKLVSNSDVVVTQHEMRLEVLEKLAALCKAHKVKLLLNPAPARAVSDATLGATYVITPNETELGALVGETLETDDDYVAACKQLLSKGVRNVVVTLGSAGCLFVNAETVKRVNGFKVKAVDTVGAGDSFTGALAALIDKGVSIENALPICCAVGALAVQKEGAIPSLPYRDEVEVFLKSRGDI